MPAAVQPASRPWFQPLLFRAQLAVLSRTKRTFGTWAAMFGLVVKRSVSSPTRSTPAASAEPQQAKSAANSDFSRRRWRLFILFSLYLFLLLAVSRGQPHLDALVDLGGGAGLRIAGRNGHVPISVLRCDARERAVAARGLEEQALRPIDVDSVGLSRRLGRGAGRRVVGPQGAVGNVGRARGRPAVELLDGVVEELELVECYLDRPLRLGLDALLRLHVADDHGVGVAQANHRDDEERDHHEHGERDDQHHAALCAQGPAHGISLRLLRLTSRISALYTWRR